MRPKRESALLFKTDILYVESELMLKFNTTPLNRKALRQILCLTAFLCGCALGAQAEETADSQKEGQAESEAKASYSLEEWKAKREQSIRKENNKDGEARFRYAYMLFSEAYYERAQELWSYFAALFPSHPRRVEAMHYLALIAEKQGRYVDAMNAHIHTYQEAAGQDAAIRSYLHAGRLAVRLGEIERAEQIFKEVIKRRKASYLAKMAQMELDALKIDNTES